jgi:hypothetical protein
MEIIILLIILLILFPQFMILILLPLGILLLFILPILILTKSVAVLFYGPKSILKIAFDSQLRRNHALEHATINVLEEKYPESKYSGFAERNGFKIIGLLPPPEIVYEAAQEGLRRLQNGEKNLAIHKKCGTSLIISNILFALLFLFILLAAHKFSFLTWLILIFFTILISEPLGVFAQKYLTTKTDVKSLYIMDLEIEQPSSSPIKIFIAPNTYFIKTSYFKVIPIL